MGDPELMADNRSRAIADAKIFKISTPLIVPGCRITRNFRDGSQEHPYCPARTAARCRFSNGTTCWPISIRRSRTTRILPASIAAR